MASMREHLRKMHTEMADHHVRAAKCLHKLAGCEKAEQLESEDDRAGAYLELAKIHEDAAQYHIGCAKSLVETEKVAGTDDDRFEGVVADRVVNVAPDAPVGAYHAVPRTGAPQRKSGAGIEPSFYEKVYGGVED